MSILGAAVPRRKAPGFSPVPLVIVLLFLSASAASAQPPTPEKFFGFRMGADSQLADWPEIERYFTAVAGASDRVRLVDAGTSTEGRHLIAAIISAPENIKRLDAIREANQRLADPRTIGDAEAARLAADHKAVVAIGASIHSSEIGATQMANELLYELASANDARTLAILRDLVVILLPSLNPDGHAIVVDWHRKTKGTPFEGGPMPWLYHKYVGHDINRDAFMMNMAESRALSRFFYTQWHPQVFLAMHQMGGRGARMFVPPNYDPVHPNYDPLIWREAAVLGQSMALELERHDRSGVISNALFDYYWPGYEDSAPLGHNTVCLLTEVASARLAAPQTVAPADLSGGALGFPAYGPQISFPNPWPGGTWRLRDIVDYEMDAVHGLLVAAVSYRQQLVEDFYAMGKRAIERGRTAAPFAFVIPPDQRDPNAASKLVDLLVDASVEVQQAQEPFRVGDTTYPAGTALVLMSQPYRAYVKTLLERQDYPVRRLAKTAPPERPYDVAGWTLPWQMGVKVDRVDQSFEPPLLSRVTRASVPPGLVWGDRKPGFYVIDAPGTSGMLALQRLLDARMSPAWLTAPREINGYRYPAGSLVVADGKRVRETIVSVARELGLRADGVRGKRPAAALAPLARARVGLYKPWTASMDEGWTRFLFDQYRLPYRSVSDADIRKGNLRAEYDVIVLPDMPAQEIVTGARSASMPPEYLGGLGEAGVAAVKAFVGSGGTLVCLDSSGQFAIEHLNLPVKDVVRGASPEEFFCPGSIVRLDVETGQPLAFGLTAETGAVFSQGAVYEMDWSKPGADSARFVARYAAKDVLMSGWLEGEGRMAGRGAVVETRSGSGRVILMGIRPQHRGQSLATFRFLFNALYVTPRM
jgi:hypothetical protein